jgi:hypothetical protein
VLGVQEGGRVVIRYRFHRANGHRTSMPGRGYAFFYYCSTCGKGWNGWVFKAGRNWTAR